MTIELLYEDEHCLVVDKPAGLMMHPNEYDRRSPTLVSRLQRARGHKIYTVHRLDRKTSGTLLIAKNEEAARAFGALFTSRALRKRYLALVRGYAPCEARIDKSIRQKKHGRQVPAITDFRCIARAELPEPVPPHPTARYSLLEIELVTGRRHQARKHLQSISHPIIGDKQYGDRNHNELFQEKLQAPFMFLRSAELAFTHPFSGEHLQIGTGIPAEWRAIFGRIQLAEPESYAAPYVSALPPYVPGEPAPLIEAPRLIIKRAYDGSSSYVRPYDGKRDEKAPRPAKKEQEYR